jgi:protein TonB
MFDTLVESSSHKKEGARTGMFFLITSLIYGAVLLAASVATIFMFSPGLVDAFDVSTMLTPPPPPAAAPPPAPAQQQVVVKQVEAPTVFAPPKEPPKNIPDPTTVKARPAVAAVASTGVPGGVPGGTPGGVPGGVPGGSGGEPPPPPPPPPPKPTPEATPPPKQVKVSGGVLQGNAIKRVQPPYPPIAKAARAQGQVQVQVTISEDGRVIAADVVSGHPLLRDAALQAARQWIFKPTELSGVPVKVQGILSFNFTLQ